MKLKKGSLEAKRYMAKIRAMKDSTKKKSIGATKFYETEIESKSTKPKRNISIERRSDGTFKKFTDSVLEARRKRKKATAKKTGRKISGVHKDTKSHNVKISVLSGIDYLNEISNCIDKIDKHKKFIEMNSYKLKNKSMNLETKKLLKSQIALAKKYILSDKKRITELKKLI